MSDHWTQAIIHMKTAIKKNQNYFDFLMTWEPEDNTGYAWSQNPTFINISEFLTYETDSDGHSGASFVTCLRVSIDELKKEEQGEIKNVIIAKPCDEDESSSFLEEGVIVSE